MACTQKKENGFVTRRVIKKTGEAMVACTTNTSLPPSEGTGKWKISCKNEEFRKASIGHFYPFMQICFSIRNNSDDIGARTKSRGIYGNE